MNQFKIEFKQKWFNKNDILMPDGCILLKVIQKPRRKWYRLLLQFISFGIYKAPYQYKVELDENKKS